MSVLWTALRNRDDDDGVETEELPPNYSNTTSTTKVRMKREKRN